MKKQLAIVIPAYKGDFLKQTLESIAEQTCKDFTLYIGDDCSPYDLEPIVDEFRSQLNIVYKRFDTNLGGKDLVAQWERCIDLSVDEPYIWLFSDDDVMEPECVEKFYELDVCTRENYLVHFNLKIIDEHNDCIGKMSEFPLKMKGIDFIRKKSKGEIASFVVEYIFPRKLFFECGRFQNYDLAWGSDILTWFKLSGACQGIYTQKSERAYVRWRRSSQNITPNMSSDVVLRKMQSIVQNAAFVQNYMEKLGYKRTFWTHSKAVWGDIKRHSKYMPFSEIFMLYAKFCKEVGFRFHSTLALCFVVAYKMIKSVAR